MSRLPLESLYLYNRHTHDVGDKMSVFPCDKNSLWERQDVGEGLKNRNFLLLRD